MTGLISRLMKEIAATIEPLAAIAEDEYVRQRFLGSLGVIDPALPSGNLLTALSAVGEAVVFIRNLADKSSPDLSDLGDALDRSRDLQTALRTIQSSSANRYPELLGDLINLVILERLRSQSTLLLQLGYVLGLVEQVEFPAIMDGSEVVRTPVIVDRINLKGIEALVSDPVAVLKRDIPDAPLSTMEKANETADILAGRFRGLLTTLGLPTVYGWEPGDDAYLGQFDADLDHTLGIIIPQSWSLDADAMLCISLSAADDGDLGVVISPIGSIAFAVPVESWNVETRISAEVDSFAFGGGAGFRALPDLGPAQFDASVSVGHAPLENGPAIRFGEENGTRLEFGSPTFSAAISLSSEINVALAAGTGASSLIVRPGSADGFLASLLPADGLRTDFDLGLGWSTNGGFAFKGAAGLELRIPVGRTVGLVVLNDCHLAIRANNDQIAGEASLTLSAMLGPVKVTIDRIGMDALLVFSEEGGSIGVGDLNLGFKWPSGVGIEIDAGVAKGGGFLFYDSDRKLYAGVLEVSLSELFTLKAYGLIQTKLPDGSPGYSLVIFLTAEDFQPIQLGMGFTLNGIGGMMAVNRTFDEAAIRQGMKGGLLDTILFPKDPVANAPAVIQALAIAFPAKRGAYLFGILVKIGWFTPTLVSLELALIMEIGRRHRMLVLGRISALLPSPDNDLVRINLDSIGVIDFDEGTIEIDAVLVDSRLVDKFALTGAMALRARLNDGTDSSFVLSIGGLNPRFSPPPGLPKLDRIAIALSSGNNPRITCEAYFAITSNTVQFGASASLYAKSYGFSIEGDIGFDILVEYQPLHFLADFHASVQLKRGSNNLFKVKVNGTLEGPRPLRVSGRASFEICWCDFSVHFDKTLVEGEAPPLPPAIALLPELRLALADPRSWSSTGQALHGVSLKAATQALAVDPSGQLSVRQRTVPLNSPREIDLFGGAPVTGDHRFTITATLNHQTPDIEPLFEQFAPAQFFSLSEEEKLTGPSFDRMEAGLAIGKTASSFVASQAVPAPLDYELVLIDADQPLPAQPPFKLDHAPFELFLRRGAAALAPVRQTGSERFRDVARPQAVTLKDPEWSVVPVGDLAAAGADASSTSWVEASASLAKLNHGKAKWQIVPAHELAA